MSNPTDNNELDEYIAERVYKWFGARALSVENEIKQMVTQAANKAAEAAAIDELEELLTMTQTNYEQTSNSDMKAISRYCANRIIQLRETPEALTTEKEGETA